MSRLMKSLSCLLAGMLMAASPVHAEPSGPQGDRSQRLLEQAGKEGELSIYTSMAEKDISRLVKAFEAKYGVKTKVWRSGTDNVLQRIISEARAGRDEVDFVLSTAPEMEALHREGLLRPVDSPLQRELIPEALPEHREWTGMRVYVYVQAYNTQRIRPDDLPRSYQDLLDPKWKGKLGVESKHEWFYTLVQAMGEEEGLRFFRKVVATNGMSIRKGSTLTANLVSAGEVPLALNLYLHVVEPLRAKQAPIDYLSLSPTIASTDGMAIMRGARHPHSAELFYDFLLSDGQKILADNSISTNRRDEAILARFQPMVFSDPVRILDSYEKWDKLFDDIAHGH